MSIVFCNSCVRCRWLGIYERRYYRRSKRRCRYRQQRCRPYILCQYRRDHSVYHTGFRYYQPFPVGGEVRIQSNKTIKGIGPSPTIKGKLRFVNNSSNVIIKGLIITNPYPSDPYDGISVKENITNVFITHCTIYDCGDGCLDITDASDYVTVSWCKFYYNSPAPDEDHRFVNLIGGDWPVPGDEGKFHVTFHHNWWGARCRERMPSVRYGRAHIYNNYYNCTGNNYCIRSRADAECLIQNNYFYKVDEPYVIYTPETPLARIEASGNVLLYCTTGWDNGDDDVFDPPYLYTPLDDACDVRAIVMAGAGAPACYGDLDRNESVDYNDLAQLVEYWLATSDIADIDYYEDGIVNFREFALLAQNWRRTDFTAPLSPTGLSTTDGNGTVSLNWNNNSEGDLAGYNIYRSTTFGSGYAQLNVSLLSSSDYVDNTVTNGTIYYYVVTAVDTSSFESRFSSQVSAIPLDAGSIIIQESTTGFCSVDGTIQSYYAGYSGSGYAGTYLFGIVGINWKISVPSDGTYTFRWRHAHGIHDRTAKLLVNDSVVIPNISFPGTGDGSNWSQVSVDVSLTAGIKSIRLEATTSDGLSLIDYMMVTGNNPTAANCQ